jgi:hypothetical protein
MPQLVVNMKTDTQNKVCRKLKENSNELRYAPYLNRYRQLEKTETAVEKLRE